MAPFNEQMLEPLCLTVEEFDVRKKQLGIL
jgi:hypothetical protein